MVAEIRDTIPVQCINLDFLTIMFNGEILIDHEKEHEEVNGVIIQPLKYGDQLAGNKHFKNVSFLYLDGECIGEIRYNPRNDQVLNPNSISFKADNSLLYTRDYWEQIEQVFTRLGLSFDHVSKMDIAADGTGFLNPVHCWFTGKVKKVSRVKTTPFYVSESGDPAIEGYWLGSRKSDKFARCYYKKRELARSGKQYIEQFWSENELFEKCETQDIERLELSLKNAELKKWLTKSQRSTWEGFKAFLTDVKNIAALFDSAIKTLFDFRENDPDETNVSRLTKLFVLDFSPLTVLAKIERAAAIVSTKLRSLKTTAKNMFMIWKKTGAKHFQILGEEIAANIFQTNWYEKQKKKWNYEFNRERKKYGDYFPVYDCFERYNGNSLTSDENHVLAVYRGSNINLQFNKYLVKNVLKSLNNG